MLFLTMHGIDRDHRVGQRKRAEQTLDRRDFIGLFVAVEMRQHQSRVGSEGAEYVRGAAVKKVVEASPQGLAIDRHMTLTFAARRVVHTAAWRRNAASTEAGSSCRKIPRIVV